MTDADLPQGQVRSGPPRWILVGFGCMGVLGFLIVILAGWTMSYMGRLGNTAEAWKQLAEIVPYDDAARGTPTGVADDPNTAVDESRTPREFRMLMGGESFGSGGIAAFWFGRDVGDGDTPGPNAMYVSLVKIKSSQAKKAMSARAGSPPHQARTFELQGERFEGNVLPEMVIDRPRRGLTRSEEVRGAGVVLRLREGFADPDEDDTEFDLLAFFQRPRSSEPVLDVDIERFFEPFDLAGLESFGVEPEETPEASDIGPATPPPEDD